MKVTLDMSELRSSLTELTHDLLKRNSLDIKMLDASVIDHLQEQFDAEGMTVDGARGTFTENDFIYDMWKAAVYGEERRMHKTHRLRENVATAGMTRKREGDEILFEWSWDAINEKGFNYGEKYQNDPSESGRHLVLTEPFLEEIGEMLSEQVASLIEEAFQ